MLRQKSRSAVSGAAFSGNVPGIHMYKELAGVVDNPADTFYDPVAEAAYFYDGTNWWTGECAQSIKADIDYMHCQGMGGVMTFSLYDMDPSNPALFNDVANDIGTSPGSCATPSPSASPTTSPTSSPSTPPSASTSPSQSPSTSPSPTGGSGGTCSPAWNPSTSYVPGDNVSYNGVNYTSTWWSTGVQPGSAIAWNIWKSDGPCTG